MPPIGHMDWIVFGSAFRSSLWIGLDWVTELMDWIGLDLKNWTHVQLCCAMSETGHVMKADQNEKLVAEETTASKQGNPNRRRQSCCAARPAAVSIDYQLIL